MSSGRRRIVRAMLRCDRGGAKADRGRVGVRPLGTPRDRGHRVSCGPSSFGSAGSGTRVDTRTPAADSAPTAPDGGAATNPHFVERVVATAASRGMERRRGL